MCGWLIGAEIDRARVSTTDAMGEELEGSMARRVVDYLTDKSAWFLLQAPTEREGRRAARLVQGPRQDGFDQAKKSPGHHDSQDGGDLHQGLQGKHCRLEGDDPDLKRKWECQCLVTIAGSGRPQARITIQTWLIKIGKALKAAPTDWFVHQRLQGRHCSSGILGKLVK